MPEGPITSAAAALPCTASDRREKDVERKSNGRHPDRPAHDGHKVSQCSVLSTIRFSEAAKVKSSTIHFAPPRPCYRICIRYADLELLMLNSYQPLQDRSNTEVPSNTSQQSGDIHDRSWQTKVGAICSQDLSKTLDAQMKGSGATKRYSRLHPCAADIFIPKSGINAIKGAEKGAGVQQADCVSRSTNKA